MGGLVQPIPGIGDLGGRVTGDIATLGLAEALPSNIKEPFYNTMGSVFFSPASALVAGGVPFMAGGIGGGGFGAAAPAAGADGLGLSAFTIPGGAAPTLTATGAPAKAAARPNWQVSIACCAQ